jgi:hypothetical protein
MIEWHCLAVLFVGFYVLQTITKEAALFEAILCRDLSGFMRGWIPSGDMKVVLAREVKTRG